MIPLDPPQTLPPSHLLAPAPSPVSATSELNQGDLVRAVLGKAGVDVDAITSRLGASVRTYSITLAAGVAPAKVERLADTLAVATGRPVRYAGIDGHHVTIEVARVNRANVHLDRAMLTGHSVGHGLSVAVGQDNVGATLTADLATFPHLLVAGSTGSGKSEALNALITGLVMRNDPAHLGLVLIDPKRVELTAYARLPHLIMPVITEVPDALTALKRVVKMMDDRYTIFEGANVKSIGEYNSIPDEPRLPRIVVVIDELADLMMMAGKVVEEMLVRLGQLARAAGIHLVLATQRPAADTITKKISANIPARMVFAVQSHVESNMALGERGAERLTGRGDGLWRQNGGQAPVRFQGSYIEAMAISRVVKWWNNNWAPAAKALHPWEVATLAAPPQIDATRLVAEAAHRAALDAEGWIVPTVDEYVDPTEVLNDAGITGVVLEAMAEVLADRIADLVVAKLTERTKEN